MKLLDIVNEQIRENETIWMWISPEDKIIQVPKLKHQQYINRLYPNFTFEDDAFDAATKDGWVRGIYEYDPGRYKGTLTLSGWYKDRVIHVLKNVFKDLIKYGNKTIDIQFDDPKEYFRFSTFDTEGKQKLLKFLHTQEVPEENLLPQNLIDKFYSRIKSQLESGGDIKADVYRIKKLNNDIIPSKINDLIKQHTT